LGDLCNLANLESRVFPVRLVLNAETKNKKKKEKEKDSKREKEKAGWFAGSTKKESPSSDKQDKAEGPGRP
jgi:hypothetical protein